MAAKMKNKTLFHISDIHITNLAISWENNTLRVPEIARIWIGRTPTKPVSAEILLILLFLTLSFPHPIRFFAMAVILAAVTAKLLSSARPDNKGLQVNIELSSGKSLSFLADGTASAIRFYDTLKLALNGMIESEITFDSNGAVEILTEEASDHIPVLPTEHASSIASISNQELQSNPLLSELQILYRSITEKADTNSEILHLIGETFQHVKTGNREGLKQGFEQFITLGLIGACNELGLESLIQEIRNSIY